VFKAKALTSTPPMSSELMMDDTHQLGN